MTRGQLECDRDRLVGATLALDSEIEQESLLVVRTLEEGDRRTAPQRLKHDAQQLRAWAPERWTPPESN